VSVLYAADDGHDLSANPDDLWAQHTTSVKGKKRMATALASQWPSCTSTAASTRISRWTRPEKSLATIFIVPAQ
jgi:hypothetical protein